MSIAKCLVVPLLLSLSVATAAQELPPLVSVVPVPEGGSHVLVTRLDPAAGLASSVVVAPGGAAAATAGHASTPGGIALPSPVLAQRFLTHYTDTLGWKHQLETSELAVESPDQHAARHAAALAQLVLQFPPAPGAPAASAVPAIEPGEQILKTAWLGMDGLDHEVLTARKPNENMDKWAERHADGVAALLKVFPPKPTFALVASSRARVA